MASWVRYSVATYLGLLLAGSVGAGWKATAREMGVWPADVAVSTHLNQSRLCRVDARGPDAAWSARQSPRPDPDTDND